MKKRLTYLVLFVATLGCADIASGQQTEQFSQYIFNRYALNPAVGGSKKCWDVRTAARRQWWGFEGAPLTGTLTLHKAFGRKEGYRKGWHGLGVYFLGDQVGPTAVRAFYPSYTYHLPLKRGSVLSFGVFVGIRQQIFNGGSRTYQDLGDPVLGENQSELHYPDITPGIWYQGNSFFGGLSVKQIYKSKLGSIGSPSKLKPHYNLILGKSIASKAYYYTFVPSLHLKYTLLFPPSLDLNLMMYMKDKIGFGLGIRYPDAVIANIDVELIKNLRLGYAFDFTTSKIRNGGSNAHEIMLSYSPCSRSGSGSGSGVRGKAAKNCPAYN